MMLDLKLEVFANQTGFLMTGGQITGGVVNITGNFSNTAAVFVKVKHWGRWSPRLQFHPTFTAIRRMPVLRGLLSCRR